MSGNLYDPPRSDVSKREISEPGSPYKAFIAGLAIEIIGSILVGSIVGVIYGVIQASGGMSPQDIEKSLQFIDPGSPFFLTLAISGLLVSVMAGYVCMSITRTDSFKTVYILGSASLLLSLISSMDFAAVGIMLILALASFAAVVFGGYLKYRSIAKHLNS